MNGDGRRSSGSSNRTADERERRETERQRNTNRLSQGVRRKNEKAHQSAFKRLYEFVLDQGLEFAFDTVIVPKYLRIKNKRLGILNRTLQGAVVFYAAVAVYEGLFTPFKPRPYGWEIFSPRLELSTENANFDHDHCGAMDKYQYTFDSVWN